MPHAPKHTRRVDLSIPVATAAQMEAFLHSPTLARVPKGAINAFLVARVREFFATRRVGLSGYEGFYAEAWIAGPPDTVARVLAQLTPRAGMDAVDEAFPDLNPTKTPEA